MSTSRSILVIKLGALGDLVQSLDAFFSIRRHHPDRRLILLTTPPFAAFGAAMPWFDAVWLDRRPRVWQLGAWASLIGRLRAEPLERVYDLQSNQRTGLYFRLLAGRRPEWSGEVRGCSHPRPPFLSMTGHNHDRLLAHVRSAGVLEAGPAPLDWLDAEISRFTLPARFVLLIPGCSPTRPGKRWPAACYGELALRLERRGIASVAIGTGADRPQIEAIRAVAPGVIDLSGQTSLPEVGAIARAALGAVGNDTGPIFIAGIVGAPTLSLMSSRETIAERMAPLGPDVGWLERETLAALGVDEVEAALRLRPESGREAAA
ncbi:MAG: glycosyltransferase family 9 protein [Rhodospirillaceae bacterium]